MRIHLVPRRMQVSREERGRVVARLRLALSRYGGLVRGLVLFVVPREERGIVRYACRLVARTRWGHSWTAEDVHPELLGAVDGVARSLVRLAARSAGRPLPPVLGPTLAAREATCRPVLAREPRVKRCQPPGESRN